MTQDLSDTIATRELEVTMPSGELVKAVVMVGAPYRTSEPERWECAFQIVGVGHQRIHRRPGVDSMQALLAVLLQIAIELRAFASEYNAKVAWLGLENPLFPLE
jgi:hypothetical protein